MTTAGQVAEAAAPHGLTVAGVAPTAPGDGTAAPAVALLAPDAGFWAAFAASPEAADGRPDPVDRWSRRVVGRIACDLRSKALFPFGGPPWRPFTRWARDSGAAWESPVRLLVHDTQGLWISFRGAVALSEAPTAAPLPRPCDACPRPCLSACPVGALSSRGYDTAACHAFLDTPGGRDCLEGGCLVRRACPVGAGRRDPRQSAFHMRAFHGTHGSRT